MGYLGYFCCKHYECFVVIFCFITPFNSIEQDFFWLSGTFEYFIRLVESSCATQFWNTFVVIVQFCNDSKS